MGGSSVDRYIKNTPQTGSPGPITNYITDDLSWKSVTFVRPCHRVWLVALNRQGTGLLNMLNAPDGQPSTPVWVPPGRLQNCHDYWVHATYSSTRFVHYSHLSDRSCNMRYNNYYHCLSSIRERPYWVVKGIYILQNFLDQSELGKLIDYSHSRLYRKFHPSGLKFSLYRLQALKFIGWQVLLAHAGPDLSSCLHAKCSQLYWLALK